LASCPGPPCMRRAMNKAAEAICESLNAKVTIIIKI